MYVAVYYVLLWICAQIELQMSFSCLIIEAVYKTEGSHYQTVIIYVLYMSILELGTWELYFHLKGKFVASW